MLCDIVRLICVILCMCWLIMCDMIGVVDVVFVFFFLFLCCCCVCCDMIWLKRESVNDLLCFVICFVCIGDVNEIEKEVVLIEREWGNGGKIEWVVLLLDGLCVGCVFINDIWCGVIVLWDEGEIVSVVEFVLIIDGNVGIIFGMDVVVVILRF